MFTGREQKIYRFQNNRTLVAVDHNVEEAYANAVAFQAHERVLAPRAAGD